MIVKSNKSRRMKPYIAVLISVFILISVNLYAGEKPDKQNPADKIDEYLSAHEEVNNFSGSVLVSREGTVLISKGYGLADRESEAPNTALTKFRLLSLTKQFTAMAIMILEERDLLNTEDSLSMFIPDYPEGDTIKLKHLLTHTSGIPDHTELKSYEEERRVFNYSLTETIESFKDKPLQFTPGEKFSYSNSGYILLGYVIEQVSEMPFEDFIGQNIFDPLMMENSGFEYPERLLLHRARGYVADGDQVLNAPYRNMANAHASGALYSTIEDMHLWDRALYTEELVTESTMERIFSPVNGVYGYGWGVVNLFNRKMVGHNGESDGFKSNITRFIEDDVCIVILSNMENTSVGRMSVDLAAIVFGEDYEIPKIRTTIQLDEGVLQKYVGRYEVEEGFWFDITLEGSRLFCRLAGQDKLEMHAESEAVFFFKEVNASITFVKGVNQSIETLILRQGGQEISADRKDRE